MGVVPHLFALGALLAGLDGGQELPVLVPPPGAGSAPGELAPGPGPVTMSH